MSAGAGPRFEVRVDSRVLAEDLPRCTKAGRAAIEPVIDGLHRDGAPCEWLRRCDEEAYKPALVLIGVGERHPDQPWRPSVYEIAHRRLNS